MYVNCSLKRSPDVSHTQGLMDVSMKIMKKEGVRVNGIRLADYDIAPGVYPDMTEFGWEKNAKGQYLYYDKVGGCIITGNEDGVKHCAMGILYSLQHIGYSIPPQADSGWIGEVGPGPSYLDKESGAANNDFTNRNTGKRYGL